MRYLLALLCYLAVLGGHSSVPPAPLVGSDLITSFVANDTDLDDDVVSTACVHNPTFDDSLQNFDQSHSPALAFRVESRSLFAAFDAAHDRLDDRGLFRPPRA